MSCDLDLSFDLAVVILTIKILSGLYLGNRMVQKIDTCKDTGWEVKVCNVSVTLS